MNSNVPQEPRSPSVREEVLEEARQIVTADRNQQYGNPEQNFETIAALWTPYLQRRGLIPPSDSLAPHDVAVLMILVKVARIGVSPTVKDHYVDIAGYSAGAFEVAKET